MKPEPLNVLLCYNSPVTLYTNYSGKEREDNSIPDDNSETWFEHGMQEMVSVLREHFSNVTTTTINGNVYESIDKLRSLKPDVIFNLVESIEGNTEFEAYHEGLYELMQVRYTGNIPVCTANCLNKFRAKQLLKAYGLPVPGAAVWNTGMKPEHCMKGLQFPVITKLLTEDASIGISEQSVVHDMEALETQCAFLAEHFHQPVLIEEYIEGREFNIAVLGKQVLPVSEICFDGLPENFPKIVTYEGKWMEDSVYYRHTVPQCPANITVELREKLQALARHAYEVMQCRDYARIDVRTDKHDAPYVIEVNPNPDLSSDAGFARAAKAAGLSYSQLLKTIVDFARERN
ncbi:MAG: ATP-grasp domain-containing protein [Ignavibacteriales bacterium]|nr:ATP-grasp domain-containing protein [Ignavibacteriales bacterium]